MAENQDLKHTDKRTVARYLDKGLVDEKAYDKHLRSLPDVAEKSVPVETVMDDDDLDDDLADDDDTAEG